MPPVVSGWASSEKSIPQDGFKICAETKVKYMLGMLGLNLPVGVVDVRNTELAAVAIYRFDVERDVD